MNKIKQNEERGLGELMAREDDRLRIEELEKAIFAEQKRADIAERKAEAMHEDALAAEARLAEEQSATQCFVEALSKKLRCEPYFQHILEALDDAGSWTPASQPPEVNEVLGWDGRGVYLIYYSDEVAEGRWGSEYTHWAPVPAGPEQFKRGCG